MATDTDGSGCSPEPRCSIRWRRSIPAAPTRSCQAFRL